MAAGNARSTWVTAVIWLLFASFGGFRYILAASHVGEGVQFLDGCGRTRDVVCRQMMAAGSHSYHGLQFVRGCRVRSIVMGCTYSRAVRSPSLGCAWIRAAGNAYSIWDATILWLPGSHARRGLQRLCGCGRNSSLGCVEGMALRTFILGCSCGMAAGSQVLVGC